MFTLSTTAYRLANSDFRLLPSEQPLTVHTSVTTTAVASVTWLSRRSAVAKFSGPVMIGTYPQERKIPDSTDAGLFSLGLDSE